MIYKIYKIECLTTGKIYIGQTRTDIKKRINSHIQTFNTGYELYYCHSHDVLLNNNFTIEIIDEMECDDFKSYENKKQIRYLETFYMKYFNSINGSSYSEEKNVLNKIKDKYIEESKDIKIKYDYNKIKRNILNIKGAEEIKNKTAELDCYYQHQPKTKMV